MSSKMWWSCRCHVHVRCSCEWCLRQHALACSGCSLGAVPFFHHWSRYITPGSICQRSRFLENDKWKFFTHLIQRRRGPGNDQYTNGQDQVVEQCTWFYYRSLRHLRHYEHALDPVRGYPKPIPRRWCGGRRLL